MFKVKTVLGGAAIGIANLLPGVSGGTIAVILNIYDQIISAINGVLTDKSRRVKDIIFLSQLLLGAILSIAVFANILGVAIGKYPEWTFSVLLGLIAGSIPGVYRKHIKASPSTLHIVLFLASLAGIVFLSLQDHAFLTLNTSQLMAKDYVILGFSGFIAAGTMVIPGISGSLMLLLLGTYTPILQAISQANIPVIAAVGIGAGFGLLTVAKVMGILLKRFPKSIYFVIIGLLVGSLVKVGAEAGFFALPLAPVTMLGMAAFLLVGIAAAKALEAVG